MGVTVLLHIEACVLSLKDMPLAIASALQSPIHVSMFLPLYFHTLLLPTLKDRKQGHTCLVFLHSPHVCLLLVTINWGRKGEMSLFLPSPSRQKPPNIPFSTGTVDYKHSKRPWLGQMGIPMISSRRETRWNTLKCTVWDSWYLMWFSGVKETLEVIEL